jgi:transposase
LAGHGLAVPKNPHTGALKALLIARRGAIKARTAAIQQIKDLLITAPADLRERYRRYPTNLRLIEALLHCRPTAHENPTTVSVLIACKALAQRTAFLERQDRELTAEIDTLTTALNPALRAAYGVGPDTAAQLLITAGTNAHRLRSEAAFAMLAGAAPIPASSGKTTRHRLSRGGDRAANNALHRIALVRWSHDPRTREYVTRQLAAGRSKKDILRLLKRAIAREMFRHLTAPCPIDDYSDLRPARQARNITLTTVANHFGVWPTQISRLERGLTRDDTLATNYRNWLNIQLIDAA